jgi:integral membrane sensor domain MASE1
LLTKALLAAWLIERYFGLGFTLGRLQNVLALLAAAVVATAASGIGGMISFKLFHSPTAPMWTTWQHWFASDATGIIIVTPLVTGLAKALREPPPRGEIIEGVAALVALAATIVFVILLPFEPWQAVRPAVLLFPVLLWLGASAAAWRPIALAISSDAVELREACLGPPASPSMPEISRDHRHYRKTTNEPVLLLHLPCQL